MSRLPTRKAITHTKAAMTELTNYYLREEKKESQNLDAVSGVSSCH